MHPNYLLGFYLFMTALFAALILVPALRRWALDSGTLDEPDERKVHQQATPRLGGIAIFGAFLFSLLLFKEFGIETRALLAGALIIFITGLADDLYGLSPKKKFLGQIIGCLVTILVGDLYLTNLGDLFGFGPILLPGWFALPFTLFAVVGIINAINLVDGLDGLAGGISVIALAAFLLIDLHEGSGETMLICATLLGAILGFLKYNAYPARIFMGDVGSLVVGFLLAFLAVMLTQRPEQSVSPVVPVLVLGLPIIDTLWVMTRRLLQGGSPFCPDKTHLHHKFLQLGFRHRFTVLIIYSLSLFWAVVALVFHEAPEYLLLGSYLGLTLLNYIGLRHVLRHQERFRFLANDGESSLQQTRIFQQLRRLGDRMVFALKGLVGLFLLLSIFAIGHTSTVATSFVVVTLVAGSVLLYLTRDPGNHFVLTFFYLTGILLVALVERGATTTLLGSLQIGGITNLLFALMVPLIALKIIFKHPEELFLSTPFDFLILAMSVSLVIVSPELTLAFNLPWVVGKGIVLFLALKIIGVGASRQRRQVSLVMLATLGLVVLRQMV